MIWEKRKEEKIQSFIKFLIRNVWVLSINYYSISCTSRKFAVPMKAIHPKTKSESTPETRGRSRSLKRTNSMRNVSTNLPNPQLQKRRSADPAKSAPVSTVNKPPEKTISNPSIAKAKSQVRRSAGVMASTTKGSHARTFSSDSASHSRTRSTSTSSVSSNNAQNTSQNEANATSSKMPKLTIPTTPTFMRYL